MNAAGDALIVDAKEHGRRMKRLMKKSKKPARYDREFSREEWAGVRSEMVLIRLFALYFWWNMKDLEKHLEKIVSKSHVMDIA